MGRRSGSRDRTVGLVSLGCPKNLVDAEAILGALGGEGWIVCADHADARVLIINTCCFIKDAEEEALDAIRRACQAKKRGACARVVVTGCLAKRRGREILDRFPEVDAIAMPGERSSMTMSPCDAISSLANSR